MSVTGGSTNVPIPVGTGCCARRLDGARLRLCDENGYPIWCAPRDEYNLTRAVWDERVLKTEGLKEER